MGTKGENKQFNKRTTKRREKDDDAPRGKMMGKYTRFGYGGSAGVGKKHGKEVEEETEMQELDESPRKQARPEPTPRNRAEQLALAKKHGVGKNLHAELKEEPEMQGEGEEEGVEIQEPSVSDLVVNAIDQKPLDFQQSFADLMQQNIANAIYDAKLEIAAGYMGNTEPDETEWDNEGGEYGSDEEDDEGVDELEPEEPDNA
jgi:hypothetical protein